MTLVKYWRLNNNVRHLYRVWLLRQRTDWPLFGILALLILIDLNPINLETFLSPSITYSSVVLSTAFSSGILALIVLLLLVELLIIVTCSLVQEFPDRTVILLNLTCCLSFGTHSWGLTWWPPVNAFSFNWDGFADELFLYNLCCFLLFIRRRCCWLQGISI